MPRVGRPKDRPMTGPGAWRYTHFAGTAALCVLLYGSSVAACIPGTEAIKPTVVLEPEAQSGRPSSEAASRRRVRAACRLTRALVDGVPPGVSASARGQRHEVRPIIDNLCS